MSIRRFMRAVRHWKIAFWHGASGAMFGWGTVAAGFIIAYVQPQLTFIPRLVQASWWFTPLESLLAGLLAVTIINAVGVAPYRTWRMLNPFRPDVVSGQLDSEYPKEFPRQSAAVIIKNLSYRQRSNCVAHIWQIVGFDNQHSALPRFISEFSLLPGDTQQIKFLSWTTRSPPHRNDSTFMLSGPIGGGYGGNVVTLPCGSHDIDIRIGVPEADPITIRCRVWADCNDLRAALLED
jgi:hypothetical protein